MLPFRPTKSYLTDLFQRDSSFSEFQAAERSTHPLVVESAFLDSWERSPVLCQSMIMAHKIGGSKRPRLQANQAKQEEHER